jgi:hypothetical protein
VPVHLYGTVVVCKMGESHPDYSDVTTRVFGEQTSPSFTPKRVKQLGTQGSNLIWKLTSKMGPAELVAQLQANSALRGWTVELLPPQPLIFIATVNNIVSLVRQLRSMGRDYEDHLFCLPPLSVAILEEEYDRKKQSNGASTAASPPQNPPQ